MTTVLDKFTPETKATFVNEMFAQIAPRYDLMNRLMTFGLDQGWRRYVVKQACPLPVGLALDVGTGTGDLAISLGARARKVVGVDFCREMVEPGVPKVERAGLMGRVTLMVGDALALPFPENSFDSATTGFAIRNVADIGQAFREMTRVIRPGGHVVCLEVARPRWSLVRFLHHTYFNRIVPVLGLMIGGNREAYTYLPQSASKFPPPPELKKIMEEAGLTQVRYRLLGFGAVAVHTGLKEG